MAKRYLSPRELRIATDHEEQLAEARFYQPVKLHDVNSLNDANKLSRDDLVVITFSAETSDGKYNLKNVGIFHSRQGSRVLLIVPVLGNTERKVDIAEYSWSKQNQSFTYNIDSKLFLIEPNSRMARFYETQLIQLGDQL